MKKYFFVFLTMLLTPTPSVFAQSIFNSTDNPVVLLELYTSESCSSCPPAERWISKLQHHEKLWQQIFPLSFHVNYWNYLNWEDRFSQARWSQRQRALAKKGNVKSVYTPGFVSSGWEWHGWRRDQLPPTFYPEGDLTLKVDNQNTQFSLTYQPNPHSVETLASTTNLTFHVAVVGMGFKTHVHSGENKGKVLEQDFVVLDLQSTPYSKTGWSSAVPSSALAQEAKKLAIVAWISAGTKALPLQIVGGWLVNANQ